MPKKNWEYAAVIAVGVFLLVTPPEVWQTYWYGVGIRLVAVFGITWAFMCLVWDQRF